MGNAREVAAILRAGREQERSKQAAVDEVPDLDWVLEPATGTLTQEPVPQQEELAVPHAAAQPAPTPTLEPFSIQSSSYVWD